MATEEPLRHLNSESSVRCVRAARSSRRNDRYESVELKDPRVNAFVRLRACRNLDDVLAIDSPPTLVRRLFGPNASRTLIEPLGDAIVAELACGRSQFSSIGFASACSDFVDPQRLQVMLGWGDLGADLLWPETESDRTDGTSLTVLADNLRVVLAHYVDPRRREGLLASLWAEVSRRNQVDAAGAKLLADARRTSTRNVASARQQVLSAFETASRRMPKARCAAMHFEWHAQEFLRAQAKMLCVAAVGRDVTIQVSSWLDDSVPRSVKPTTVVQSASSLLVALARLENALDLVPMLPKDVSLLGECTRKVPSLRRSRFVQLLSGRVDALITFAAGDPVADQEHRCWSEDEIYLGAHASLRINRHANHTISIPAPPKTISAAVAQVARLVRLGAKLPEKPTSWPELVSKTFEPYFAFPALAIDSPDWVSELEGKVVPGTDLTVGVPRNMGHLARWADHMGNCIQSIFGEDVNEGSRVILGLFKGGELLYNVGVMSSSRRIWEINSRFNTGDVPCDVYAGMAVVIARTSVAGGAHAESLRVPRPRRVARPKRTGMSAAQQERFDHITKHMCTDNTQTNELQNAICLGLGQLLHAVDPTRQWPGTWPEQVAALRRVDDETLGLQAIAAMTSGCFQNGWAALMTHPLDPFVDTSLDNDKATTSVVNCLTWIRNGDDRVRLAFTSPLLENPLISAAWQLGRIQRSLRSVLVSQLLRSPDSLRWFVRPEKSGRARRALSLVLVGSKQSLDKSSAVVWADLAEPDDVQFAFEDAKRLAPDRFDELLRVHGLAGMHEVRATDFAMRRAELGMSPPQCPRSWFRG